MDRMNPRLERNLRLLGWIVVAGVIAGVAFNIAQGRRGLLGIMVGIAYGLVMSLALGSIELFVLEGPMRVWLGGLPFTANLMVRSAIYAAVIFVIQWSHFGERIAGVPLEKFSQTFWSGFFYAAPISVVVNLALALSSIIGPRPLLNFVTGRYHSPVEESRFVLLVDIS